MYIAKVFQSGNSQAIRIPKEMQTTNTEFIIRKTGDCYYLLPPNDPWALLRQTLGSIEEDIDFNRDQPLITDLPTREEMQ